MRIPLHLLRREFIPRPPAEEQKAIAAYLRVAEKRINRFIRNRQKLIERLNEQKQAIINRAVTRGLDPNARLIPSGVDWLGDVPEYWEVRRIRNCLEDTKIGLWGDEPTPHNRDDHVTCVRVADFDMRNWGVSTTKLTTRAIPKHLQPSRLLQEGDLLMEKSGGGGRRAGRPGCDVQPQTLSSIFKLYLAPPAK
jgi:type I restriction enzyme S subunit